MLGSAKESEAFGVAVLEHMNKERDEAIKEK